MARPTPLLPPMTTTFLPFNVLIDGFMRYPPSCFLFRVEGTTLPLRSSRPQQVYPDREDQDERNVSEKFAVVQMRSRKRHRHHEQAMSQIGPQGKIKKGSVLERVVGGQEEEDSPHQVDHEQHGPQMASHVIPDEPV